MNAAERRALLGDTVIAQIHERVAAAPEASPELIDKLRRILTRPAGRIAETAPVARTAEQTAPAADAA